MRKPNKEERLEVYKTALDIYKANKGTDVFGFSKNGGGLCLLLPCIYEIKDESISFCSNLRTTCWTNTTELFPEFGDKYEKLDEDAIINNEWRIKVLEEIISEMEAK